MARLQIKAGAFDEQVIELRLGVNRLGRDSGNEFRIQHSTISARHCEITLSEEGVRLRDCGSTNGTFVNGERVREAVLSPGQTLRLGDVELVVETTDATIAIPKFDRPQPAPPIVLNDGSLLCPRHPGARVTYQCTHCREVMCEECVHKLHRKGGSRYLFCPLCSHACEPLGGRKKKKKSLFALLQKTIRLPLGGRAAETKRE